MTHHQDDLEDDFDYEDEDNQQTDAIPDTIRGFVFSTSMSPSGPTGIIRDMAANEYLLTPAHWIDESLPFVGQIVEFEPRVVEKGRLAASIMPITASTLLTPTADETWLALANEEAKMLRRRQLFYRISHLVLNQRFSPERAIIKLFDIELTSDVDVPMETQPGDRDFILNFRPNHSPRATHPTAKRLCKNLSLDFPRLVGFMRGNIQYRAALEQTLRKNAAQVKRRKLEAENRQNETVDAQSATAETSTFKGIANKLFGSKK